MSDFTDRIANLSPEKRELLLQHLQRTGKGPAPAPIPPQPGTRAYFPLSFAQERLWLLDQLEPGTAAYNIPTALRLTGALKASALAQSLNALVKRHEILRTTFTIIEGQPVQVVAPELTLTLSVVDLQALPAAQRESAAQLLATTEVQRPFDLSQGPLVRGLLLQLSETEHLLVLTQHHIVSDGWSMGVFYRDLLTLYQARAQGRPSPLPDLTIQYADYAVWHRQWLETDRIVETQLPYWRQQLGNHLTGLELPTDHPRPAIRTARGRRYHFELPGSLTLALEALSRQAGVTLFQLLLAAFNVLLHRHTGQNDIVVGSLTANRSRIELEPLIGFFTNTLVLRTRFNETSTNPTFYELLGQVREVTLNAYAHQDLPIEKLIEALQPERDLSRPPLFQVLFLLQNAPSPTLDSWGLTLQPITLERGTTQFDLTLELVDAQPGLLGSFEYDCDIFESATIQRWAGHFQTLLASLVTNPDQRVADLSLLTETERRQLLWEWNATQVNLPLDQGFLELFEAQVERTPESISVACETEQLSYRALAERVNGAAQFLKRQGVGPQIIVALLAERGIDFLIAILAVFKAGGAYLPLDPHHPAARHLQILRQSRAALVLVASEFESVLAAALLEIPETERPVRQPIELLGEEESPIHPLSIQATPADLAYVIYTSGSTGLPKGAMVEHRGMLNHLYAKILDLNLTEADVVAQTASQCFDISVWQFLAALLVGGRTHILKDEFALDPLQLLEAVDRGNISILETVPSLLRAMLEVIQHSGSLGPTLRWLRWLVPTGEALPPALCRQWFRCYPDIPVLNAYGPTECSDDVTHYATRQPPAPQTVHMPIGRPVVNMRLYILDTRLRPVPLGIPGELYVGGIGVGRGYLHDPRRTAESFLPDPFASQPGQRLYKTGDRARYLPDSNIEFLGRIDYQVKIRGFRIELGEIEVALSQLSAVREVVVVARQAAATPDDHQKVAGEERLVAYVTPQPGAELTINALRNSLKERLPDYMIPAVFVFQEALPLTPNGKIDRNALPAPEPTRPELDQGFVAPRTPVEEVVAGILAQVLGALEVGVHDNFFELGGHSLLATQVISRLRNAFQVEIPLRRLFEFPTVQGLAENIETARRAQEGLQTPPLVPITRDEPLPLSFAQQRLWFLDQLVPGSSAYNIPAAVSLQGDLNITALAYSLNELVRRHEALRTIITASAGQPNQIILHSLSVALPLIDLCALSAGSQEAEVQRLNTEEAQQPFDLGVGPLLRATLLRLSPETHLLRLTLHHIISDGWSAGIVVQELSELYAAFAAGRPPALPRLPIQYADFAYWQREWLQGERLAAQIDYWRQQLSGSSMVLELPTDYARPSVDTFRGAKQFCTLPAQLTTALKSLSQREGVTLFMTLLAAFQTLLHRYTGQDDILIGSPIANRRWTELEGLVGFFANTLVLRGDLSGNPTFRELLRQARETTLSAYTHQDLPFEKLVEALQPERDLSRNPLFQVMFALQNAPLPALDLPGLTWQVVETDSGAAKFDLWLSIMEGAGELSIGLEYSLDLFNPETIARLLNHFENLLNDLAAHPERRLLDLALLSASERQLLLSDWNATTQSYPTGADLHSLIEAQVERTPEAPALIFEGQVVTYQELNRRANQLAHYLKAHGVGPETRVGVCVERSVEMVVGLLATLKAGGAYVPLDPAYPSERLAFMLADSGSSLLLTQAKSVAQLPHSAQSVCLDRDWPIIAQSPSANPKSRIEPDNLAYVIYTSGSTGKPKGVAITHRSAVGLLHWTYQCFAPEHLQSVLAATSICFDLSVFELFVPLSLGGRVILVEDALQLPTLPGEHSVSLVNTVPSAMTELLRVGGLPESVAVVNLAGEPLPLRLAQALFQRAHIEQVYNLYGPSEDTTYSTYACLDPQATTPPPIGRPITNTRAYVLDVALQPTPIGVPGELYLGGLGLARGYLNRPDLTAERFVPNPFATEADRANTRLYKTGDLVRYLPDGNLEYVGRIDHQVKIRGFRIELGEIETALGRYPALREAVVVARAESATDKRLVAYVVPERPSAGAPLIDADQSTQVAQWQQVFDETYRPADPKIDPTFNINGWKSSYTGLPMPVEEMREWVEHTVARIQELHPRRVLEIGCGTGLLLFRLAPQCEYYYGTDFSAAALHTLRQTLTHQPLPNVQLAQRTAADFTDLPSDAFDVIILNSVIQYFPSLEYLGQVLENAAQLVKPGGAIFIGDVRSLPLLETFHTSIELYQAPASLTKAELRQRIYKRLSQEEELVVDPAFFLDFPAQLPQRIQAQVLLKRGRAHNELTRYRYDVIWRVDVEAVSAAAEPQWFDWQSAALTPAAVQQLLAARPEQLWLTRIPNARLSAASKAVELLNNSEGPQTVKALRDALSEPVDRGVDPETLRALSDGLPYTVEVSGSGTGAEDCYEVVFTQLAPGRNPGAPAPLKASRRKPWGDYANQPLRGKWARQLLPQLRRFLQDQLPDHMVPSAFVFMEALPLTPNGKVNRQALPAPDGNRPALQDAFVAPQTPLEKTLVHLWTDVLGVAQIGIRDNFFELGGHSLLATQVISRVRDTFQVNLPLRALFEAPTIAELAAILSPIQQTDPGPGLPPLLPVPQAGPLALSFAQERLWFLDQFTPGSPVYNVPTALRLQGPLNVSIFRRSVTEVIRRHASLRTTIAAPEGQPSQFIRPAMEAHLPVVDLQTLPAREREAELLRLAGADARRAFDLSRGPLLRITLVQLAEAEHVVILNMHHIISDGWSMNVLVEEMVALYVAFTHGRPSPLPELSVQYVDFAAWQRQWLQGAVLESQLDYWKRRLTGAPAALAFPTDHPRPALQSFRGAVQAFVLSAHLSQALAALCRQEEVTLFMTLLAAFQVLLARYSGQDDIVVGTPIANRNRADIEKLIGFFVNTLVLRTDLSGNPSFRELLQRVRETALGDFAHQDLPFEKLVEALRPERELNRSPLFQVMFVLQNAPFQVQTLPGLTVSSVPAGSGTAKFDLTLSIDETGQGLVGGFQYNADLFDRDSIVRLSGHFITLLEGIAARPEQRLAELPLLAPVERQQLLTQWAGPLPTSFPSQGLCLPELFEAQVEQTGNALAILGETQSLTYHELNQRANQLAHHLRGLGVGAEVPVALCLERSPEMIIALLGVLKAGGAYLPLDPSYPADRLAFILEDSAAPILLTQSHLLDRLPHGHAVQTVCLDTEWPARETTNLIPSHNPDTLAYILYTSGSTGQPKGALVQHGSLVNYLSWVTQSLLGAEINAIPLTTKLTFDASLKQVFGPLLRGQAVWLIADETLAQPAALLRALRSRTGVAFNCVPSLWQALLDAMQADPTLVPGQHLTTLLVGGERLTSELVAQTWRILPHLKVWNLYGPTESTANASAAQIASSEHLSIGSSIANAQFYVLDRQQQLTPIGVAGELHIGGVGLARGYLRRPELTAEKFMPHPFSAAPGARLYRSGDLVRWLPDGSLQFLGRVDDQVKVRGFRIEPGEVETALRQHPMLKDALVTVREATASRPAQLVAYVVPAQTPKPSVNELRRFLQERLPDYMVPSIFVSLSAIPLNLHGKVDRRALQLKGTSEAARPQLETAYQAPRGEMERLIASVWQEVLQVEQVGVEDNFFDLGGHSLLVVQVHSKLRAHFRQEISLIDLFRYPTVGALARYLAPTITSPAIVTATPAPAPWSNPATALSGLAIVGLSGRFPGAKNVEAFWHNLREGLEAISFFSEEELDAVGVEAATRQQPNYVRARGILADVERFDAAFFGYSPREAELIDPQQRIFLECAWEALENAGYAPGDGPQRVGVFAGLSLNRYLLSALYANPDLLESLGGLQASLGNDKDFLATRVSYKLNLKGPSFSVQTACSTSLVAVSLACESLLNGKCDLALAGGASIHVPQQTGYLYQEGSIVSPDGHCRAFDARAQGTLSGNGVGVVVLKRLADALVEGDSILAVIKGFAINNDGGDKVGYTAPSIAGQAAVIQEAQALAGVGAETITYLEAHGTATPLGDPIEIAALTQAFRAQTDKRGYCALGSVKTNVGHLDAAAGVAGLIKTVLALKHKQLPPSLHFTQPNPQIDFANSPFFVNTQLAEWKTDPETPRRAGVSSFGIGGTNAHVVLEEAPPTEPAPESRPWQLLVISAKTGPALELATANLADHLKAQPALNLADVAYTLQVGRKAFKHRRMLVARDLAEAAQALMTPEQGRVFTHLAEAGPAPVIFMFPGQGAQAVNMGRTFYETESVFREQIDRCAEILKPQLGFDLRQRLYPAPAELEFVAKQLNETWLTQPALFAIEYALAQQWLAWGIRPQAMIGHSLGEYVAACLAGVFSLEEALTLVATRGQLMSSLPVGAMLAVPKSESEVRPLLGDWLSLAAINAPDQCVVSGPISAIEALRAELQQQGLETQRLQTSHAFHSMMMDPMVESFVAQVRAVNLKTPQLPYLSNVSGAWITAAEATDPDYWGTHLRQTVRFAEGLQTLLQDPQQIFLEVGPGRTLNGLVHGQTGASRPRAVFTSLPLAADQESDPAFLLTTLGRLWLVGASANWTGLYAPGRRRRIPLPTYPFERQRYWLLDESASGGEVQRPKLAKRATMAEWFYGPSWKRSLPLDPEHLNKLAGHRQRWLVFMDACGLGASLVRRLERENQHVIQVNVGKQFGQSQAAYTLNPERPADYESLFKELRAQDLEPHKIIHLWSATPEPAPDQVEEGEQHLTLGFYSLLYLTQALGQLNGAEIRDLTVVSNHVYAVQGDEFIQPEKAAILGPCKVIPHEYPQLRCRHIDLQLGLVPAERMENLLDQLLAEIIAESPDRVVTYRGNHRWIQAAEPVALERVTPPGKKLRERGVYLITGGLGGIGLWLAEYLAQTVQARLILVGRSEFPPVDQWEAWLADRPELDEISHKIRRLQALEAEGAEFSVQTADVTDEAQMQNVVTAARQRWGTIHGVIHAAGVPGGGLIQLKTGEAAAQVLAPKIKGTRVLEKIFKTESLDFFVLCSSLNAILGTLGQVDYCAANAFLDAFALANSAHSQLRPLSINWSRWQNVGMAASAESKHQSLLGESLAEGMTPQEGLEAFGRALARSTFPQIIISPRDFQALLAREAAPPPNWLAQLEAARPIRTSHPRPALGSAYVAPRDEVEQQVANIWQQLLGLDSVGVHDNFFELGGHSLLATQIAARLRDAFPVELPLRRLFDAPTVAQLAEVVRDALIEKLQGLSEEEAERLL